MRLSDTRDQRSRFAQDITTTPVHCRVSRHSAPEISVLASLQWVRKLSWDGRSALTNGFGHRFGTVRMDIWILHNMDYPPFERPSCNIVYPFGMQPSGGLDHCRALRSPARTALCLHAGRAVFWSKTKSARPRAILTPATDRTPGPAATQRLCPRWWTEPDAKGTPGVPHGDPTRATGPVPESKQRPAKNPPPKP